MELVDESYLPAVIQQHRPSEAVEWHVAVSVSWNDVETLEFLSHRTSIDKIAGVSSMVET